jgi:hypothetical protein
VLAAVNVLDNDWKARVRKPVNKHSLQWTSKPFQWTRDLICKQIFEYGIKILLSLQISKSSEHYTVHSAYSPLSTDDFVLGLTSSLESSMRRCRV